MHLTRSMGEPRAWRRSVLPTAAQGPLGHPEWTDARLDGTRAVDLPAAGHLPGNRRATRAPCREAAARKRTRPVCGVAAAPSRQLILLRVQQPDYLGSVVWKLVNLSMVFMA